MGRGLSDERRDAGAGPLPDRARGGLGASSPPLGDRGLGLDRDPDDRLLCHGGRE